MKVYDGGNKNSYLILSMTGSYKNTKVSSPRNQMFIEFETTSIVVKRGFQASIFENSNNSFQKVLFKHNFSFFPDR